MTQAVRDRIFGTRGKAGIFGFACIFGMSYVFGRVSTLLIPDKSKLTVT